MGPAGPSAILVTAVGSTFANTPVANADAVDCEDGVALQMFGATASVTVTDPNLNQRVNVAATAVFSPGGSTDQQSLFLDLCYRDGANNVFSEGLEMGALELSGTTTMPFTLGWTFGEGGDLAPGTYHFGLCGCVAGSTSTWDVEGTRVTAQLIQK